MSFKLQICLTKINPITNNVTYFTTTFVFTLYGGPLLET